MGYAHINPTNIADTDDELIDYLPLKQGTQDLHKNPISGEEGRLNTLEGAGLGGKDNTQSISNKGNGEDGEQIPTQCINCQTTNTPIWRRDPEGQPLCKLFYHSSNC
jgi:hypothetical protein